MILRLGKPKRIDSEPGFGLKLPLIEDVRPVSRSASHRSEGEGRFLTVSKESLSLTYRTRWRVTDPEVFFIATGGHVQSANARIDSLATDLLRHRVAELSMVELRQLRQSGSTHSGLDDQAQASGLLGDVLEKANDRTADLGIEITHWRVDVVAERAG